jgi:uncharacterized protein
MNSAVSHDDVARALAAWGAAVQAAEAHGCLCGALCARRSYREAEWLAEVLPDGEDAAAAGGPLDALYAESAAVLAAGDIEFTPLLPDDDADLQQRVEALAAWCQGYLYGFGAAGALPRNALGEDVVEFLADVAELARVGTVGSAGGEPEEEAYVELVEYLRVGVQLAYDQLADARASQPSADLQH